MSHEKRGDHPSDLIGALVLGAGLKMAKVVCAKVIHDGAHMANQGKAGQGAVIATGALVSLFALMGVGMQHLGQNPWVQEKLKISSNQNPQGPKP